MLIKPGKQHVAAHTERVCTGALKFGDDWTGVFIRGDECGELRHIVSALGQYAPEDIREKAVSRIDKLLADVPD